MNFQTLKIIGEKKMATGLPKILHLNQLYKSYLVSKQARLSFLAQTRFRAEQPPQLIHVDLCDSITPSSIAGNNYFLLLVDNYNRWMWVYMLKEKGEELCHHRWQWKAW